MVLDQGSGDANLVGSRRDHHAGGRVSDLDAVDADDGVHVFEHRDLEQARLVGVKEAVDVELESDMRGAELQGDIGSRVFWWQVVEPQGKALNDRVALGHHGRASRPLNSPVSPDVPTVRHL